MDNLDDRPGTDRDAVRLALSRLMDGDPDAVGAGCSAFAADGQARADWHAYHVVGDVLRSEHLARDAAGDAAFLARLRGRLAQEPAVLAPAPVAIPRPAPVRRVWLASAAVAAGFMAVAAALVVTRESGLAVPGAADRMASVAGGAVPLAVGASAVATTPDTEGTLIRNADLDRYLAAHRDYAALGALSAPGAGVRKAAVAGVDR